MSKSWKDRPEKYKKYKQNPFTKKKFNKKLYDKQPGDESDESFKFPDEYVNSAPSV